MIGTKTQFPSVLKSFLALEICRRLPCASCVWKQSALITHPLPSAYLAVFADLLGPWGGSSWADPTSLLGSLCSISCEPRRVRGPRVASKPPRVTGLHTAGPHRHRELGLTLRVQATPHFAHHEPFTCLCDLTVPTRSRISEMMPGRGRELRDCWLCRPCCCTSQAGSQMWPGVWSKFPHSDGARAMKSRALISVPDRALSRVLSVFTLMVPIF